MNYPYLPCLFKLIKHYPSKTTYSLSLTHAHTHTTIWTYLPKQTIVPESLPFAFNHSFFSDPNSQRLGAPVPNPDSVLPVLCTCSTSMGLPGILLRLQSPASVDSDLPLSLLHPGGVKKISDLAISEHLCKEGIGSKLCLSFFFCCTSLWPWWGGLDETYAPHHLGWFFPLGK